MTVIDRKPSSVTDRLPTAGGSRAAAYRSVELGFLGRLRAWMLVLPVDFLLMLAPLWWRPHQFHLVVAMAVLATFLLTGGVRYCARLHLSVLDEFPTIFGRLLTAAGAVALTVLYLDQKSAVVTFLETAFQAIVLVLIGRVVTTRLIAFARRSGIIAYRTVLIGGGPLAAELAETLEKHPAYGLKVEGFVDEGQDFPAAHHVLCLGGLADLDAAVVATGSVILLVADGNFDERTLIDAVRTSPCQWTDLLVVPRMHHFHTQTGVADHIGSIPVMRMRNPNLDRSARLVKRLFDVVLAVPACIVVMPVVIGAALAVRIEAGPGVVFRQTRVGRDGKQFKMLKFRTMRPTADIESEPTWCEAKSGRVGPVGRFLRCTSIDELPQLWNILRGDMTFVGPRPEQPYFVEQFSLQIDRYADRHRVQVGLTGLAQVSGLRGDTSIVDRARYDNFYIENWSLWLDIKIILRTFREVFSYREF